MATKKVTQGTRAPKKRAEKPVSEGAGIPVADAMAEVSKAMDTRVEGFGGQRSEALAVLDEVKALRELAQLAELLFEGEGLGQNLTREQLLGEALVCAREDIDLLADGATSGCGINGMQFARAKSRINLALKLADYRGQFGSRAVPS